MLRKRLQRFRPERAPQGLTLLYTLQVQDSEVYELAWSPDGQMLAVACSDRIVRLWDTKTGRRIVEYKAHTGPVLGLSWSPDGKSLASSSADNSVCIWSIESSGLVATLKGHEDFVSSVAWAPTGNLIATGSGDWTIRIWQPSDPKQLLETVPSHSGYVSSVSWSHDGKYLASASEDRAIHVWTGRGNQLYKKLYGHSGDVYDVAWSPDGTSLASAGEDRTIRLWNVRQGYQVGLLEGHSREVFCVAFSPDNRILASKSDDGTVRLWRCGSWETLAVLVEPTAGDSLGGLAFHPEQPLLATHGENGRVIRVWRLDYARLVGGKSRSETRFYRNAKVVLLGDTGVGKSGLSLALTGQQFVPTESTHGRHIWTFESNLVAIGNESKETRETLIWDLAGQAGYRLLHQLYLNEVAVALIVFDARSETEPFSGVRYWDRALRQAQSRQGDALKHLKKYLVAARSDRGGIGVSADRIATLVRESGFSGYFETSAKEGWQIPELKEAIRASIDWDALPKVVSTELFETMRQFILDQKKTGGVSFSSKSTEIGYGRAQEGLLLTTLEDLFKLFTLTYPYFVYDEKLRDKFLTCISLVESRGLIRRLSFGDYVLLQPELLDSYASAVINTAKDEPDGLGLIAEEDALAGRLRISQDERVSGGNQEKLLLIATIEELIRHELALREVTEAGVDLVFPSQLTRELPEAPDVPGRTVVFSFQGAIQTIYSTLVVRLTRSRLFRSKNRWKNAAAFTTVADGTCGLYLRELGEGAGELTIFFDERTDDLSKFQFQDYVKTHLERRILSGTLHLRIVAVCSNCGEALPERAVNRRRDLGHSTINCPVCDTAISLLNPEERLKASKPSAVAQIDRAANLRRDRDTNVTSLRGKIATRDYDVFISYNSQDRVEARALAARLRDRGLLPWLDEWEIRPGDLWQKSLENSLDSVGSVAVLIGSSGVGPWQDLEQMVAVKGFVDSGRRVIPIILESYSGDREYPDVLNLFHHVDFRQATPDPFEQLIWGVTGERERFAPMAQEEDVQ